MSAPVDDDPFTWNVAGLLGDTVGADRHYEVADARVALPDELTLAEPIAGRVRLTHTNRGILARANLHTALAMECVRCLRPTTVPLELSIEDEFLPSVRGQIDDIRDLGFPEGDEDELDSILDDAEDIMDEIEDDPESFVEAEADPFEEINTRLASYGITSCAG